MIISASRRTDIPAHYADWIVNRIQERQVRVRNPMNARQIRTVSLEPHLVDCIVFWSKNPQPMLDKLELIKEYAYYFQFTLTPYEKDVEANLPSKDAIIETFKKLSCAIGPDKVLWRYDPVLLNAKYTASYHIERFNTLANALHGYTNNVTFSFIDTYKKISARIKAAGIHEARAVEKSILAQNFSRIAAEHKLAIDACAEDIDLSTYGIAPARCIDDRLIAKITGRAVAAKKDKNQRSECRCVESVDIGEYNTCTHACLYCYANRGPVQNRTANPFSPLLTDEKDEP
jgi:DNA repair photolyase